MEQLRAFAAVAAHQHVTHAATELGVTQPAVSHQLKALERVLGLAVFERAGRGVRLSADGRALLPAASAALAALRSLEEAAAARTGLLEGDLTVAASNTIGIYRVPAWAAGFLEQHPSIGLQVRTVNTHDAVALLREAVVDCALVEGPGTREGLEELGIELDEVVVVVAAGHPLAGRPAVRGRDLAAYRYLARERGSGTRPSGWGMRTSGCWPTRAGCRRRTASETWSTSSSSSGRRWGHPALAARRNCVTM